MESYDDGVVVAAAAVASHILLVVMQFDSIKNVFYNIYIGLQVFK